jgi:transposase, IS30 family
VQSRPSWLLPKTAEEKAIGKRYEKLRTGIPLTTYVLVVDLIKQDWSPEQISSRVFAEQGPCLLAMKEFNFMFIRTSFNGGDFHKHLRCQKKRRKRYRSNNRRGRIPNQISINEHPY